MESTVDLLDIAEEIESNVVCNCKNFAKDLLNFSWDILATEEENLQWEKFKDFMTKYLRNNLRMIADASDNDVFKKPCLLKISSIFLQWLEELRRRGMALSSLLLDLLTVMLRSCGFTNICCAYDFEDRNVASFISFHENTVFVALNCEPEFMKLMVNFGLLSSLPNESSRLRDETRYYMLHTIWAVSKDDDFDDNKTFTVVKEVIKVIKNTFLHRGNTDKRMLFIVIAIQAIRFIRMNNPNLAENHIRSLRMYFTGTRDPYLSMFEVRSAIYTCFKIFDKLHIFDIYSEIFDNLMPECPAVLEPRRLTDLARCQLRESLKGSCLPLPVAVNKLHLPPTLKKFVIGDEEECISRRMSRLKRGVSAQKGISLSELEEGWFFERPVF